jgi:hypothetical protein
LYLLTCPHRTTEGFFRLPKAYMQADLEWSPQRLQEPFGELLSSGFLDYDGEAEVVLVRNALKYQPLQNDNQVTAALRSLDELPPTHLTCEFKRLAEQFCERLAERLPKGYGEPSPTSPPPSRPPALTPTPAQAQSNPSVEHDASDDAPARPVGIHPETVRLVFETWRKTTGKTKAKCDSKRTTRIVNALKTYPLEDVLDAVQGWQHSPHHCGHNDTGTVYNDLELLLRDAKHIEGFRDLQRDGPTPVRAGKQTRQMLATDQALTRWATADEGVNGNGQATVGPDRRPAQRELARPADRTANRG